MLIPRVIGVAGTSKEAEGRRKLEDSNRRNLESGLGESNILLPLTIWPIFPNPMIPFFKTTDAFSLQSVNLRRKSYLLS